MADTRNMSQDAPGMADRTGRSGRRAFLRYAGGAALSGRRAFLRYAGGAALSVLAVGTRSVLDPRPASAARGSCCGLVRTHNVWCPYFCGETGSALNCWACNNGACLCCECSAAGAGYSCFFSTGAVSCSYSTGCCESEIL